MHTTMTNFNELQKSWNQQPDPKVPLAGQKLIDKASKKMQIMKLSYLGNLGTLSLTILILVGYWLWALQFENARVNLGLGVMVFTLSARIALEVMSIVRLGSIQPFLPKNTFQDKLKKYYQLRKTTHLIATPIAYTGYIAGFSWLLPALKPAFSEGMYLYMIISGYGSLLFISWLVYKQAKTDFTAMKSLRE